MKTQVLLAAYNGAAWLPEQLRSLQEQSDPDFSVLWQDDGSSDNTPALLRRISGQDARFLPASEQGKHLGARGNFFSLLRQTEAGEALLCDQDDSWEPQKIARLKQTLHKAEALYGASTPILVHSDCVVVDEAGAVLHPSFFRHQGWDPGAVTLPRLLVQNNVTGCTLIMNRPLISLAASCADPDRVFMHDWFLALTAASFGRVVFLNEPLTRYRQHAGNAVGASVSGQIARGAKALSRSEQARSRIRLTYTHTRDFQSLFGNRLPPEAQQTIRDYLATEHMSKLARLRAVRRLGCLMQSPVTRAGQMIFG